MTITLLRTLIAQGNLNYYSKHIIIICQSEFNGLNQTKKFKATPLIAETVNYLNKVNDEVAMVTLVVTISVYINGILQEEKIEVENADWHDLYKDVLYNLQQLKDKAYLAI